MNDLISRKLLIKDISVIETNHPSDDKEDILEKALATVDIQPTIEAVPVVHGSWIEVYDGSDYDDTYECSKCGKWLVLLEGIPEENHYDFCPFCGARMDGKKVE